MTIAYNARTQVPGGPVSWTMGTSHEALPALLSGCRRRRRRRRKPGRGLRSGGPAPPRGPAGQPARPTTASVSSVARRSRRTSCHRNRTELRMISSSSAISSGMIGAWRTTAPAAAASSRNRRACDPPHQLHHLAPVLLRVRGTSFCHRDTSSAQWSGIHESGGTPYRIGLRHDPPPKLASQGLRHPPDHALDDLQDGSVRGEILAPAAWLPTPRQGHQGSPVQRRHQGPQSRRMNNPSY